jgi:DNA-directed RNA polymerase subunit RPC12/RpoP
MKKTVGTYLDCPMCDCEIPISGEEDRKDDIFCPYCDTPLLLKEKKDGSLVLQENF